MNMESYLEVTYRFINHNVEVASVLLAVGHFTQSYTSENLRDAIRTKG